jgi:23S rRNA A1618 N6-methylase RlmF
VASSSSATFRLCFPPFIFKSAEAIENQQEKPRERQKSVWIARRKIDSLECGQSFEAPSA